MTNLYKCPTCGLTVPAADDPDHPGREKVRPLGRFVARFLECGHKIPATKYRESKPVARRDGGVVIALEIASELPTWNPEAKSARHRPENGQTADARPSGFSFALAETYDGQELGPDWIAEPKFDGIRCGTRDGKAWSRNLKPLNLRPELTEWIAAHPDLMLDGEIYGGDWAASVTAARTGTGGDYWVFDCLGVGDHDLRAAPLVTRKKILREVLADAPGCVHYVEPLTGWTTAAQAMQIGIDSGFEGAVLKDTMASYTGARSAHWLKLKPEAEEDVIVLATTEGRGDLAGELGAIVVLASGNREFEVGGGFTVKQRRELWADRDAVVGRTATIKYQPTPGMKTRHPQFLRFKEVEELDTVRKTDEPETPSMIAARTGELDRLITKYSVQP